MSLKYPTAHAAKPLEASPESCQNLQNRPTAGPSKCSTELIASPVVHIQEHHPLHYFAPPQQARSAEQEVLGASAGLAEDWLVGSFEDPSEGSSVCREFAILRTAACSGHSELLRFPRTGG